MEVFLKSIEFINHIEPKESVKQFINGLEKITMCSTTKPNFINSVTDNYMIEMNNIKTEAKRLLDEVNCCDNGFSQALTKWNSSYISENIFEKNSFKERIKQLRQKMHLLEMDMATPIGTKVNNLFHLADDNFALCISYFK